MYNTEELQGVQHLVWSARHPYIDISIVALGKRNHNHRQQVIALFCFRLPFVSGWNGTNRRIFFSWKQMYKQWVIYRASEIGPSEFEVSEHDGGLHDFWIYPERKPQISPKSSLWASFRHILPSWTLERVESATGHEPLPSELKLLQELHSKHVSSIHVQLYLR